MMLFSNRIVLKFSIFFMLCTCFKIHAAHVEIDVRGSVISVSINTGEYLLSKDKSLGSVELEGLAQTVDEQSAQRPFKAVLVEGDISLSDITLKLSEPKLMAMQLKAGGGTPCRCDDEKKVSIAKRPIIFQDKHVWIEKVGIYRGKTISRVMISPVIAREDSTLLVDKMQVDINGVLLFQEDVQETGKMLFVGPLQFRPALLPLMQARVSEGLNVEYLSTDAFSYGPALRDWIKAQIIARKDELRAVVFVGHEYLLPTYYLKTKFSESTPSDLPYVALDGEGDWMPDVQSGRLPVLNQSELSLIVAKILRQDETTRVMGIASNEGMNPSDAQYLDSMLLPIKTKGTAQISVLVQGSSNATAANIQANFEQGLDWINYIGHGSGTAWPSVTGNEFTTNHVKNMRSSGSGAVVIDVACQNGRFQGQGRFGETLLLKQGGGARAYYGGSVDISWDPPAIMAIGINQSVGRSDDGNLGQHLWQGQRYLLENHSNLDDVKDNVTWFHLQGDPMMAVSF